MYLSDTHPVSLREKHLASAYHAGEVMPFRASGLAQLEVKVTRQFQVEIDRTNGVPTFIPK